MQLIKKESKLCHLSERRDVWALCFRAAQTVMCTWIPGRVQNADSDPFSPGRSRKFCLFSKLPGDVRAAGLQPTLWPRSQTSSSDGRNAAWALVWTFLQSWVISLTAIFPWKTQCSAPTDTVKTPWTTPPSHARTCENILETGFQEKKKPAVRHLVSPAAVHPRGSTLVSTLGRSFSKRLVPPRPHYFWKLRVTEVPEAGGPQSAPSQPWFELCHRRE